MLQQIISLLKFWQKKTTPVDTPVNTPKPTTNINPIGTYQWYKYEWDHLEVLPAYRTYIISIAKRIVQNRGIYFKVEMATGVPWDLIGAIHYREASLDFSTCLHNGDPLGKKTTHVPAGRGPFFTWEEAAIDALIYDNARKWTFNGIESELAYAEAYNGLGYRKKGLHSCYIFSMTNRIRSRGRYTYDHVYNPLASTHDSAGVAALLKEIESISKGIR
jgi:lysozyme family protein